MRRFDVLMSSDRVADAEKLMKDALAAGNAGVNTNMFRGALSLTYLRSGRPKEALDLLNQVLAADPRNPGGLLYHCKALLMLPNPDLDQVAKELSVIREVNPEDLDARYLLAEVQRKRNDMDSAVRELEEILRQHPEQKRARLTLMELYANTSPPRWVDAERVARDAANVPSLANDPEVLVAEANLWRTKGEPKRAIQRLDAARKAGATDALVNQTLLSILIDAKAYTMAMQVTDQLPLDAKNQWWAHQARGRARAGMGDMQGATQEFEAAIQLLTAAKDDRHASELVQQMADAVGVDAALRQIQGRVAAGNPGWIITAAQLHERKSDLPTARKMVDDLLSKPEKLTPMQKVLALTYAGHAWITDPDANMARAKDAYGQLTQLMPDDYIAWNNLACIKGLPPEESLRYSQMAYDKMQKANINEPYVLDTHGWNLVQVGRTDEGLSVLLSAWATKQFPEVAYHLAVANKNKALADRNPALLVESEKYLTQASDLFGKAVERHEVADLHLGDDIQAALREVRDLRSKQAAQAN
jgi:tetratricopeptide (TPR) repeat protein